MMHSKWLFFKNLIGFVPETFLIAACVILIPGLLLLQKLILAKTGGVLNLNKLAALSVFVLSIIYFLLIYTSPVEFITLHGLQSGFFIYCFRLVFSFLMIPFFLHLFVETRTKKLFHTFEHYYILIFAFIGLHGILICTTFFNLFLFIELYALSVYYLLVDRRLSPYSTEAAFKYFVISSVSSAIMLFGAYFVYYATGSIDFNSIKTLNLVNDYYLILGVFLVVTALLIKIGAGLFYFWILDAYEGANFMILTFLNLFVKAPFLIVLFRILCIAHSPVLEIGVKSFLFLSVVIGGFGAITQTKIKRFLIFTSIYNLGFFSSFFWVDAPALRGGFIIFYAFYVLNSLGLFILFSNLVDEITHQRVSDIKELSGLSKSYPSQAYMFIFMLFVIAGLPPFSFFFAKYVLFFLLFSHFYYFCVVILLLMNAFALFYYIRIIRIILGGKPTNMFFKTLSRGHAFLLSSIVVFNLFIIFFIDWIIWAVNYLPL